MSCRLFGLHILTTHILISNFSSNRTYLRTLATFPKPLIAGIVGNLKNLGVMQLPLFDYVLAAEDCCFETNYAKLGQLPEGYAFWHKHQKVATQLVGLNI